MSLEDLTALALQRGLDRAVIVDNFRGGCGLDLPLNPSISGDTEMLQVANLDLEDSGVAPLLWAIAIAHLKAARAENEERD